MHNFNNIPLNTCKSFLCHRVDNAGTANNQILEPADDMDKDVKIQHSKAPYAFLLAILSNQIQRGQTMSNDVLADEKFSPFHQYLSFCHRSGTSAFSIPGTML